jgi:succinate dehydrogenase / fumarate reductase, iron-sulfur subunit
VTPKKALLHQHKASKEVKRIFEHAEEDSVQLNLYVVGYEDDIEEAPEA